MGEKQKQSGSKSTIKNLDGGNTKLKCQSFIFIGLLALCVSAH